MYWILFARRKVKKNQITTKINYFLQFTINTGYEEKRMEFLNDQSSKGLPQISVAHSKEL